MLQQAPSLSSSLSFIILSLMLSLKLVSTTNSIIYVQCSQLNFTARSSYESNVNSLFTTLDDSSSIYIFNKCETSPQSNIVYGLFQCRGDLSNPDCSVCVASAIRQLKTACPMSTGGEIQLEGCFVKYDDTSFFGAQDKMEACKKCGPSIGYNSDVLNRIDDALAHLVGGNGEYFREGDFGSIHGVAQCVQDLSLSYCQDCLAEASGRLRSECETSTWGNMYLGKCYILYDDQGNKNITSNTNSGCNKSSGRWCKVKLICYILSAVTLATLAITLVWCTLKYYKKIVASIKNIFNEVTEVKKEVKNLEEQNEEVSNEVMKVKKEVKNLEEQNKEVSYEVTKVKKEVKNVEGQNKEVAYEVKKVRDESKKNAEQITAIGKRVINLEEKNIQREEGTNDEKKVPICSCPPYVQVYNQCRCNLHVYPDPPYLYENPSGCYLL